jgi:hypothetical protein
MIEEIMEYINCRNLPLRFTEACRSDNDGDCVAMILLFSKVVDSGGKGDYRNQHHGIFPKWF